MQEDYAETYKGRIFACLALMAACGLAGPALAQQAPPAPGPTASSFQGSVPEGQATDQTLDLSLDDAMQRGLRTNLGIILSGTQTAQARGERLVELQNLLPSAKASATETLTQVDLPAEGLRLPNFPKVIGPFGYTDVRASLSWSLVDVASLRDYLASKHSFNAAQLSAQDARDLVVLTVGNAYLLVLADEAQVSSVQAQVDTAKVSLQQAADRHQAGTAPLLDELRARVDAQTIEQELIVAQDDLSKDKLALARVIGLPLAQNFRLTDEVPFAAFERPDVNAAVAQAEQNRKDVAAAGEQTAAAVEQRKAATAQRYPVFRFDGDYGDIGPTLGHSHGTGDATGKISVPIFDEFELRGEAEIAQSQLDTARADESDRKAQVDADVRDALLDIASTEKQVEVARSSMELANEALTEAQERYKNGISDNLAVSQAQQSVAQANDQYVTSLYRHNVAKLSLARALGAGDSYKTYLGGK